MSTRPVQDFKDTITLLSAAGAEVADTPVKIGAKLFVVPQTTTAAAGEPFAGICRGVLALPKSAIAAVNFAVGANVYWNEGTKLCTATATDDLIGTCVTAAGNTAATVNVDLIGRIADAVDADAVAAAGLGTLASLTTTDKTSAVAAINEIDAAYKADIAALAKLKSGTVTVSAGQSVGTVAMGAATWDGKPVLVSVTSSAGAYGATVQSFEAAVAAGTLTVTATDAAGAPLACTADVVLFYMADGR